MQARFATTSAVKSRYQCSDATIDRRLQAKELPSPVYIGRRRHWPIEELDAVDQARIRGATHAEIKDLIARIEQARKTSPIIAEAA